MQGVKGFRSKLDDMEFLGDFFGVAAAFDAELLEDVDDMRFDGSDLDTEDVGDLLVAAVAAPGAGAPAFLRAKAVLRAAAWDARNSGTKQPDGAFPVKGVKRRTRPFCNR